MVKRSPAPKRLGLYQEPRTFWLWRLLGTLAIVTVAYVVAVFSYLVLAHMSEMPHGPLWTDEFRGPLLFVMIVAVAVVFLIPYFQREWDRGMRTFSIFSALFLLAFASLSATRIVDPSVPLRLVSTYAIEPLRHVLRF